MTKSKPKKSIPVIKEPAFELIFRASGVVELGCEHGVGHPIKVPPGKEDSKHGFWVHGCDHCCSTKAFKEAEAKNLSMLALKKFYPHRNPYKPGADF